MAEKTKDRYSTKFADKLLHDSLSPLRTRDPLGSQTRRNRSDSSGDELIHSLSDARENRRARQVFEWEIVRRNTVRNI